MLVDIGSIGDDKTANWMVFTGERLVANKQQGGWLKATWQELAFVHHYSEQILKIGDHDGVPCYAIDVGQESLALGDLDTMSLRGIFLSNNESLFSVAAKAWQYILFKRTHRFCGQCGSSMEQVDWEMAVQCHTCRHRCYPRVSPCIIVAIRNKGKILLAQGKAQKERKMFSVLAGFVESGESLEEAVHREVFEEVGIKIKNLAYYSSQPWPFPHSLMMGFLAEFESGDIKVDGHEILEADWYAIDEMPFVPPNMSIAGRLIDETKTLINRQS